MAGEDMGSETLLFTSDDGTQTEFEIIADTRISGITYLLAAVAGTEDEVLVLKDVSRSEDEEASYVILEEGAELDAVIRVFEEDNDLSIEQ